jgi:hypothetical protein
MPAFKDYTAKKIGRVYVISQAWSSGDKSKTGKLKGMAGWNCKCDCGNEFTCWSVSFKRGDTFECKECWYERRRGIDLIGRKFGRWTVLSREIDENNKTKWKCKCDCGNYGLVSTHVLGKKGRSMSCGCLGRKEKSKYINTTLYPPAHGLAKNRFYMIKTSLIHKCYNEKHPTYKNFGAKGITVCDLWRNGAKDMYEWAIENEWEESDVIILKIGEKEFNPSTCLILKESDFRSIVGQKGGKLIEYNKEIHSVSKWAKLMNIQPSALRRKLLNCPVIEDVFNSKFRKFIFIYDLELEKKICNMYLNGKTQTEISTETGIRSPTIRYQLIKNNIELRKSDVKKYKRPEIVDKEIMYLYCKGLSMNGIAKKLGCSFPTIKKRMKIMELLP